MGLEERQARPDRQDRRHQQARPQSQGHRRPAKAPETPRAGPGILRRPAPALHHRVTRISRLTYALLSKYALRSLLLAATVATVLPVTAAASSAGDVTPAQLTQAGWTCIPPRANPTQLICAPPGKGLPPLPGTPGF